MWIIAVIFPFHNLIPFLVKFDPFQQEVSRVENLLSVRQVAELLGLRKQTVYVLVMRRQIPHLKIGEALRFDPDAIRDFIEEKKQPAAS